MSAALPPVIKTLPCYVHISGNLGKAAELVVLRVRRPEFVLLDRIRNESGFGV